MASWCAMMISKVHAEAAERVVERVRELAGGYEPPSFSHVPDPDAAIFLCAIDHRTGYRGRFLVGGKGPFEGSALLWAVGLQAARRRPGLLSAASLRDVTPERVAGVVSDRRRNGGRPGAPRCAVARPGAGLERDHGGKRRRCSAPPTAISAARAGCSRSWRATRPTPTRWPRSRSCSRRFAPGAAGSVFTTPRAGRCAPTTF